MFGVSLDAASDARVSLLVQKYEGKSTKEDSARLEILTQRLRRLSPRVTSEDIAALGIMVDQLEEISDDIDQIAKKFDVT